MACVYIIFKLEWYRKVETADGHVVKLAKYLEKAWGVGHTNGLRALIKAEQQRGPAFLWLADALSVLYPSDCEEKRLLGIVLLAVPR